MNQIGGIKGRAVNVTLRKFEKENKPREDLRQKEWEIWRDGQTDGVIKKDEDSTTM